MLENLFCPSNTTTSIENDPTADEYNSNHHNHSGVLSDELITTMNSLAKEHLQSAIQVLLSLGVLSLPTSSSAVPSSTESSPIVGDTNEAITKQTWISVRKMGITDKEIQQWT